MPYDSAGNFSLPPSTWATPGTTIRVEQHNPAFREVEQGFSSVLVRDGRNGMTGPLTMGNNPIRNVQPGTNSSDAATVGQIIGAAPVGTIAPFALKTLPTGWLWCDGTVLLPDTAFPLLRSALIADGFTYGQDGSGNPKLPDARDVALVGRGNMGGTARGLLSKFASTTLGALFGWQDHTLTYNEMPSHSHSASFSGNALPPHNHGGVLKPTSGLAIGASGANAGTGATDSQSAGVPTGTVTVNAAGGGQAHLNVQPSMSVNIIIKAAY